MNLKDLKKHMPYTWKVQSTKYKAECVAFVDARQVADRLDEVCGPENWEEKYIRDSKGNLFCYLTIWVNNRPITKSDVGTPSNFEAVKGEASDAFKRAAVKWGIGRFLYDLPMVSLKVAEYKGKKYASPDGTNILWNKEDLNHYINSVVMGEKPAAKETKPTVQQPTKKLTQSDIKLLAEKCNDVAALEKIYLALPAKQKAEKGVIAIFSGKKKILLAAKALSEANKKK